MSCTGEVTKKTYMEEMLLKEEIVEDRENMPRQPHHECVVRVDASHQSTKSPSENVRIVETELCQKPSFALIKEEEMPEMKQTNQEVLIEKKERKLEISTYETSPEAVVEPNIKASLKKHDTVADKKKVAKDVFLQNIDVSPKKEMVIQRETEVHKQEYFHENKRYQEETPHTSPVVTPKETGTKLKEVCNTLERGKACNLQQMPQRVYCSLY